MTHQTRILFSSHSPTYISNPTGEYILCHEAPSKIETPTRINIEKAPLSNTSSSRVKYTYLSLLSPTLQSISKVDIGSLIWYL
jgi:hypothetical protein